MNPFLDVEGANRAASRLEDAANKASRAADRLNEATQRLTVMLEPGYGNNVSKLIELLEKQETPEANKITCKEACREALRMYESIVPAGGWQHVHDMLLEAVNS